MSGGAELFSPRGSKEEIEGGKRFSPLFDGDGLVPAIITDAGTGDVLMFAWMNEEALSQTIGTGLAHFWSRSRKRLWLKGEESGNRLRVVELRTDCDQDALWLRVEVEGQGLACHTGRRSCFYRRVATDKGSGPAVLERVVVKRDGS
jgi:phosphoribosyl-AMP cyclohydrolase